MKKEEMCHGGIYVDLFLSGCVLLHCFVDTNGG